MSAFSKAIDYAKSNPVPVGIGVVVVGGIGYLLLRGGGSSSAGQIADANATATSAYYAAESAQGTAGDQLQATQIAATASTAQAQIAANESVTNNTTWANTDLAETTSNNATATALAPIEAQASAENNLISTLGAVASLPPITTTSTSSSSGFFGIGGGSKTSTTVTPNQSAETAAEYLAQLESGFFNFNG